MANTRKQLASLCMEMENECLVVFNLVIAKHSMKELMQLADC